MLTLGLIFKREREKKERERERKREERYIRGKDRETAGPGG